MPDEESDLERLARKITCLRTFTKLKLRTDKAMPVQHRHDRWRLVRDSAKECHMQLATVMAGFYPRRLIRRLKRTLRSVDSIWQRRVGEVVQGVKMRPVTFQPGSGSQVVPRTDEQGIFAQLMAIPRGEGQLLC